MQIIDYRIAQAEKFDILLCFSNAILKNTSEIILSCTIWDAEAT